MYDYTDRLLPPKRPPQRGAYGGTIAILLFAILVYLMIAVWAVAFAQSSNSEASSGASSEVDVRTGAIAGAQINNYGQRPGTSNTTYSEARIENAPSLGGLALGGGHPCAYSPATAQISIIGGGAGIGGSKVDEACLLAVMAAAKGDRRLYTASELIIAGRSPTACRALEQAGVVTGCASTRTSAGTAGEAPPARKDFSKSSKDTAVTPVASTPATGLRCELKGKKLYFKPSSAEARNAELRACKRAAL